MIRKNVRNTEPGKPNTKSKTKNPADFKSSTINTLLNVAIFLLFAIIVYMFYSIYVKLNSNPDDYTNAAAEISEADIIQVDVLNGCGVGGVADRFTEYLRTNNFDVVGIKNYISFDVDETLVIDRTGNLANAQKVAKSLGIKGENVIQQINKDYFIDVSLVVGRDYFNLAPFK